MTSYTPSFFLYFLYGRYRCCPSGNIGNNGSGSPIGTRGHSRAQVAKPGGSL
jgi:hypothetical protein